MALEDLRVALDKLQEIDNQIIDKLVLFKSRLEQIDPESPTAQQDLDLIDQERKELSETLGKERTLANNNVNTVKNTVPKEDAEEGTKLIVEANQGSTRLLKSENQEFKELRDKVAAQVKAGKQGINEDQTEKASEERMANAQIVGDTTPAGSGTDKTNNLVAAGGVAAATSAVRSGQRLPPGAMPRPPSPTQFNPRSSTGSKLNVDTRVKIRVPVDYLEGGFTSGRLPNDQDGVLKKLGGIIFPYTPQITLDYKAEYTSQAPIHSNFLLYFYKNSSFQPINIQGKFTVQNEYDASIYIATIHLLRSLTKMLSGGYNGDPNSGSPPPVCRLDAYGDFMLQNVPVVVNSFQLSLPNEVDYFTINKDPITKYDLYGTNSVPTVSTITVNLLPIYSRAEMQQFSVRGYRDWITFRNKGIH